MANPEHLDILKQGVEVWNKWREEHPEAVPDLQEANLSKANLSKANLSKANLSKANLSGANLREVVFSGAFLSKADLSSVTRLKRLKVEHIETDLIKADLSKASLREANLRETNLSGANLSEANLIRAKLPRANLTKANLNKARLSGADLPQADLTGANLTRAEFNGTNLSRANLTGATLTEAHIGGDTSSIFPKGSDDKFRWVFSNATTFANTNLKDTIGLDTCIHEGPSTLDHRTLTQNVNLPLAFLRGCGLSDLDIEAYRLKNPSLSADQVSDILYRMHDLVIGHAVSYRSCFISYSSQNQDFAQRLHNDLQESGVRCWFAPEDMKIGSKLRYAIDQAIHLQDQLLLILSKYSVKSPWVEQEVETALEKERQENRNVLLPIRIDQAVMESQYGWAAHLRRTRHIGDFSGWTDRDKYSAAFERLLKDLRATG